MCMANPPAYGLEVTMKMFKITPPSPPSAKDIFELRPHAPNEQITAPNGNASKTSESGSRVWPYIGC